MAVESPGTAFRAAGAPESDFPDDTFQAFNGILNEVILFLPESDNPVWDRDE
jgi:hypothetical protein